jgi:hypothetical protein
MFSVVGAGAMLVFSLLMFSHLDLRMLLCTDDPAIARLHAFKINLL